MQFAAVAREVIDAYKDESNRVMDNPVGTGPYVLKQRIRGQRIVLEANPTFRDERYPTPGAGSEPGDAAIANGLVGKRLPIIGRVDVSIVEESQPRLLSFDSGALDYVEVPASIAANVLSGAALKPELAKRGIVLHREVSPSISFFFFNLDDPLVGGYTPEKLALRRAISMSLRSRGRDPPAAERTGDSRDPAGAAASLRARSRGTCRAMDTTSRAARALLDKFGYKDRDGDGYRELPDGKPLAIVMASTTDAASRARDELWKRNLDAIGIRVSFLKNKWSELNKMSEAGQLMMWGLGWISNIPDGRDYYSYFYGPNVGMSNDARMRLPAFDALFQQSLALPDGKERTALFDQMNDLIFDYAPWILTDYPYTNVLAQPWLKGYKQNAFLPHQWMFYDVAPH